MKHLLQLVKSKAQAYQHELENWKSYPLPRLGGLDFQMRSRSLKLAVVSGAIRSEVELVLNATLAEYFTVIVAGDDITTSKPEPDYLLAVERLNQQYPNLDLQPWECLAIEDTPAGIQAAKRAGMPVGVANTICTCSSDKPTGRWIIFVI